MMRQRARQYAVELNGVMYRFTNGSLEQIDGLHAIEGDKWFISDMQKAIPRAMTLETPGKYAELMVRRKLHESGEFEEPVSVVTHLKKKRGKNVTDIFFTAVPTRLYQQYLEQIHADQDSVLFFPLYAVLFGVLKGLRPKAPVAVVFRYGRFADLIIGDSKEVFYANRCLAFDTSEEQILALWDLVRLDIKNVEAAHGFKVVKVFYINWIDSAPDPKWPEKMHGELCAFEQETLMLQGQARDVSFFKAVRRQPVSLSKTTYSQKVFYFARRCAPWLNALALLALLLMAGGYYGLQQKGRQLQQNIARIEQRIEKTEMNVSTDISADRFKKTFAFVQELDYCTRAPSYRQVLNDVSDALAGGMALQLLKIDYADLSVNVEFFGRTAEAFEAAHHGYQHFLQMIKARGYVVADSRFETEIKESQLLIKLKKPIE